MLQHIKIQRAFSECRHFRKLNTVQLTRCRQFSLLTVLVHLVTTALYEHWRTQKMQDIRQP